MALCLFGFVLGSGKSTCLEEFQKGSVSGRLRGGKVEPVKYSVTWAYLVSGVA